MVHCVVSISLAVPVVLNDLVKSFGENQNLKLGLMQTRQVS
jgi:hypothetical protein